MRGDRRAVRWWGLGLVVAAGGCFDGADAQGLPCRSDADCGQAQSCVQGFCGGPPGTGGGSSSSSSSDSSSSSSSSSSSTAITADDSSGTASSSSTGPGEGCGNGVVEAGEDCDPGGMAETAECNPDCSAATCGDGLVNAAAGEACDDGDPSPYDGCTAGCLEAIFWDDLEQPPEASGKWVPPMGMQGWVYQPGRWSSGNYSSVSVSERLSSAGFMVPGPPPPGTRYQLRVRHRYRFDNNRFDNDPAGVCPVRSFSDGGMIFVLPAGGMDVRIGPTPQEGIELDNVGGCVESDENPLRSLTPPLAYSGISANDPTVTIESFLDVSMFEQEMIQLVFEVGYDCRNCWEGAEPPGAGWTIEDVVVAPFPMPP